MPKLYLLLLYPPLGKTCDPNFTYLYLLNQPCKGNLPIADLRLREEYSTSPIALIFLAIKSKLWVLILSSSPRMKLARCPKEM